MGGGKRGLRWFKIFCHRCDQNSKHNIQLLSIVLYGIALISTFNCRQFVQTKVEPQLMASNRPEWFSCERNESWSDVNLLTDQQTYEVFIGVQSYFEKYTWEVTDTAR